MNKLIGTTTFRMPAEWEKQKGVWLQWPHENEVHGYQRKLESLWIEMTEILKQQGMVFICVPDEQRREHIERQFRFYNTGLDNIEFHIIPTNDVWARDNGPTFIVGENGELAIVNWQFNGWGGRYECDLDDQVSAQIAKNLGIRLFRMNLVAEGGNIEVNGKGTLMLTRSAVLNDNRNTGVNEKELEVIFKTYLGVKNIIWLPGLKMGSPEEMGWSDDTDTHIDTIARFVNDNTIVYSWTEDSLDPMYEMLKRNLEVLKASVLETGKHPDLVSLPIPKDGYYSTSQIGEGGDITRFGHAIRTDASYTNFLISNDVVLVPAYGNVNDNRAIDILTELFVGKKVLRVSSGAISENGGEIHCVTQQQPMGEINYLKK